MKKFSALLTTLAVALTLGLGTIAPAIAATPPPSNPGDQALEILGQTGLGGATPADAGNRLPIIIGNLIRAALGLLGIIMIALMLYAGFLWMTAQGDKTKVETAQSTITRAVIGAAIIITAYAITGFVVSAIVNAAK